MTHMKDGPTTQETNEKVHNIVCEIAETVGISGERVRSFLPAELGMQKLCNIGAAFYECRSKAHV
jgi:hypothetical protein